LRESGILYPGLTESVLIWWSFGFFDTRMELQSSNVTWSIVTFLKLTVHNISAALWMGRVPPPFAIELPYQSSSIEYFTLQNSDKDAVLDRLLWHCIVEIAVIRDFRSSIVIGVGNRMSRGVYSVHSPTDIHKTLGSY
jgi:hypothetical protein